MGNHVDLGTRCQIVALKSLGMGPSQIQEITGIKIRTIRAIWEKAVERGFPAAPCAGSGKDGEAEGSSASANFKEGEATAPQPQPPRRAVVLLEHVADAPRSGRPKKPEEELKRKRRKSRARADGMVVVKVGKGYPRRKASEARRRQEEEEDGALRKEGEANGDGSLGTERTRAAEYGDDDMAEALAEEGDGIIDDDDDDDGMADQERIVVSHQEPGDGVDMDLDGDG